MPCFTYEQLSGVSSVGELRELIVLDLSDEEYRECLEYVRMFIEDVDTYYENDQAANPLSCAAHNTTSNMDD